MGLFSSSQIWAVPYAHVRVREVASEQLFGEKEVNRPHLCRQRLASSPACMGANLWYGKKAQVSVKKGWDMGLVLHSHPWNAKKLVKVGASEEVRLSTGKKTKTKAQMISMQIVPKFQGKKKTT